MWLSALAQLGLDLVVNKRVGIVLPIAEASAWRWPKTSPAQVPKPVEAGAFEFRDGTEISKITERYRMLTGEAIVVAQGQNKRAQVVTAGSLSGESLTLVMQSVLKSAGL